MGTGKRRTRMGSSDVARAYTAERKAKRAGKPGKAKRSLLVNKAGRRAMLASGPTDDQMAKYFEFHEKDRRDRKGRMDRLKRADQYSARDADKNRPDMMKTPLLEKAISDMDSARTVNNLLLAAALKFIAKKGFPFFILKRTSKLGRRPITLAGLS